jgi:hypothetical protein
VRPQDADLTALQASIEDSRAMRQQLLAMTPAQRARHESQELIRLAICARHRQKVCAASYRHNLRSPEEERKIGVSVSGRFAFSNSANLLHGSCVCCHTEKSNRQR